jgi:peptidoglycan hydrolase-like amidase
LRGARQRSPIPSTVNINGYSYEQNGQIVPVQDVIKGVPFDQYIEGVVFAEIGLAQSNGSASPEALKAQAVAAICNIVHEYYYAKNASISKKLLTDLKEFLHMKLGGALAVDSLGCRV